MEFTALINVMPKKELLDPQGKAILNNLGGINFNSAKDVRIGKRIQLSFEADNEATAKTMVEDACQKMLANAVMEYYEFEVSAA